jgi:LmbE family N-acetylglucosaminyl deacetylase
MSNGNPVLILAAHPDDEVLGCAGVIARLALAGNEVYIAILGEGITSRYPKRQQSDPLLVEALQNQSQEAAALLGAKKVFLHHLPDNRFDTVPLLEVIKIVENLVKDLRPEIIYTHHGGDLNIDHQVVNRAVLTATRPIKTQPVREIYTFEVPSSTEWGFQHLQPPFRPNVLVDISETLDIKIKALGIYESEVRDFPHPRSPQALRAIARRWGSVAGCEAAEAFELIRSLR